MFRTNTIARAFAPLALALTALPVAAQDTERMDALIAAEADSGAFMGVISVTNDQGTVLEGAWGSANLEWDIPNSVDTKFRIGSVTKQFTSVAIMLMAEQGKLSLDAPISTYLDDTPETWEAITVRQMIRHTAGLPNVTSLEGFGNLSKLDTTQEEVIAFFRDKPLDFEPGTKWDYSNSGYVLLSRIVEKMSGTSIAEHFDDTFFTPLGMTNTGFDVSADILPKRASGYSPSEDGPVNAGYVYMGIPTGAGAMYSTVDDLHKWNTALYEGKILSDESLTEFLKPTEFDAIGDSRYAHGVMALTNDAGGYYWHSGGIQGFNAWLGYDTQRKTSVAVLANLNGGAASKLGSQLMTLAQGGTITLASERSETAIAADDMAELEGTYALAPTFKITVFVEDGKLMTQATGQGAFELFREEGDKYFLKVVDAQVHFTRDASGAVTGLTLFQGGQELPAPKE